MDEFGIFTQSFGLKPQGKSVPMAASKGARNFGAPDSGLGTSNITSHSSRSANVIHSDSGNPQNFNDLDDYNDLFGGPFKFPKQSDDRSGGSVFDYDSIFGGSGDSGSRSSSLPVYHDVIFDSIPGLERDGLFDTKVSPSKTTPQFDDLLGISDGFGLQSNGSNRKSYGEVGKSADGFDYLIPGFGGSNFGKHGSMTSPNVAKSSVISSIDELEDFAMGKVQNGSSEHQKTVVVDIENSTDDHIFRVKEKKKREWGKEKFKTAHEDAMAERLNYQHVDNNNTEPFFSMDAQTSTTSRSRNIAMDRETVCKGAPAAQVDETDIESFFSMNAGASGLRRPRPTSPDIWFDEMFDTGRPEMTQSSSAGTSSSRRKDSTSVNFVDDFAFMFGVGASVGGFQEIEGESEERRAARWKRHQETKERMAKAVADMNQRDFQTQQEQENRHRIAETTNVKIKQWSAGKEGNLRALLSTLQFVLWPECGWQPVSLTDLITSTSVKKVYKKAALCIHPDKVQQKGANTHQKYVSEKVFDLLKEAWTKFNSEELR